MRALIVDDEPPARQLMRLLLAEHRDVEVVGELGTAADALRAIARTSPDLVLLDIQMPGLTGLELASALSALARPPSVIFVTAYDQHALEAFDRDAVDYLLKPVEPARLGRALDRVRTRLSPGVDAVDLTRLVAHLAARGAAPERIAVRVGERTYFRRVEEIDWVEADGKFVRIHLGGKVYPMRETMKRMEGRLDSVRFLRVSRSAIVNLDRIREIQPWFRGDVMIILECGSQVATSRGYRDRLMELLER